MPVAASVVIPAHNEEQVLGRCLDALLDGPLDLDVVVVANACTDSTADIARARGVQVVETTTPGKPHALNLGDGAATAFPRAYVDADVLLPQASLAAALRALERPGVLASAPALAWDRTGVSAIVRAYYRVWTALPYVNDAMVGSGVYVLSQEGRGRFGAFPPIIGDDALVRACFDRSERASAPTHSFTVFPPRTLSALIGIKARVRTGNTEVDALPGPARPETSGAAPGAAATILRSPRIWPALPVYALVQLAVRLEAIRRRRRGGDTTWTRDETSRTRSGS